VSNSAVIPISRRPNFERSRMFSVILIISFSSDCFLSCGSSAGDSPRLRWSEWGSPPGQGGAPEAETTKQPAVGGLYEIRTLSGWGARYTEKKARRKVQI
jgi:hypothetical protein